MNRARLAAVHARVMMRLSSRGCALAALAAWGCLPENTYTDAEPDAQAVQIENEDVHEPKPERDEGEADSSDDSTDAETETPTSTASTTTSPPKPTSTASMTATVPPALPTDDMDATETAPTASSSDPSEPNSGAGGAGDDEPSPADSSDPTSADEEPNSGNDGDSGASPDEPEPPEQNGGDFFGDSRCSDEFVFCEDFESGELDSEVWEPQGPAPDIDDGLAARGSRSAHFHTEDNGLSLIRTSSPFPMSNNRYYARAFVYFDSMPTAPEWAHWTISGAEGSGTEAEIRVGGQYDNDINRFGVGTDRGPTGDWTNLDQDDGPQPVPTGEWVCLEWMNDGENQEGRFWWDGEEHPSLYTSASEHGGSDDEYLLPDFESVWFGWWLYQEGTEPGEFDVWIDEIVIDDEPIGCAR